MTVRARGTRFQLAGKVETTNGVAPSGNWAVLPCYSYEVEGQAPLKEDEVISYGISRDPFDQFADTLTIKGAIKVPLETGNVAFWFGMLSASPYVNTTGGVTTTQWSAATPLPSFSFEKGFLDVGNYWVHSGCKMESLAVDFGVTGTADMTINVMGMSETESGSSSAGTPTIATIGRILKRQAIVTIDGSNVGDLVSGSFTVGQALDEIRTIRDDTTTGQPFAIDEGLIKADGKLMLRYDSSTLYADAVAAGAHALAFTYVIGTNISITFTFPRVFFSRPSAPVKGPGGIEQSVDFSAAHDPTTGLVFAASYGHP